MVLKTAMVAFWILVLGVACVYLELAQVRLGYRIHRRLVELEDSRERLRRLELQYSKLVCPGLLEKDSEVFFPMEDRDPEP